MFALALAFAAPAGADYYIGKRKAEHFVRSYFHYDVGYHYTAATCKLPGGQTQEPGYVYHRWRCQYWAGNDPRRPSCWGDATIRGSSDGSQVYYIKVHFAQGNCPYGH